jgi:hypothetical protein
MKQEEQQKQREQLKEVGTALAKDVGKTVSKLRDMVN